MKKRMLKRIMAFVLAITVIAGLWIAMPDKRDGHAGETVIATPTTQKIFAKPTQFGANDEDRKEVVYKDFSGPSAPAQSFEGYVEVLSPAYSATSIKFVSNINQQYLTMSDMPVYSIIQPNGYGANYVKLRDVAALVDFNVQWKRSDPNAMYVWTNTPYAEVPVFSGPATETKVGEWSTYDIYVDGVKVEGLQPVLIDDNNYFKIRDIAKMVNFGCYYNPWDDCVYLYGNKQYLDETVAPTMSPSNSDLSKWNEDWCKVIDYTTDTGFVQHMWITTKEKFVIDARNAYEDAAANREISFVAVRPTYGYPSGIVSQTPIALNENDPWAKENYFDKYASQNLKDAIGYDASANTPKQIILERGPVAEFNRIVQLLTDQDLIAECEANGLYYAFPHKGPYDVFGNFVKLTNMDGINSVLQKYDTDREKVTWLIRWVCEKVSCQYDTSNKEALSKMGFSYYDGYDYNSMVNQGGDFFLDERNQSLGPCWLYSRLFENLASSAGYFTMVVVSDRNNHAWNCLWLPDEGRWMTIDCMGKDLTQAFEPPDFASYPRFWSKHMSEKGLSEYYLDDAGFCTEEIQVGASYFWEEATGDWSPEALPDNHWFSFGGDAYQLQNIAIYREAFCTAYKLSPQRFDHNSSPSKLLEEFNDFKVDWRGSHDPNCE